MKLYYKDYDTAYENNPDCEIKECDDYDYLKYINRIQQKSIQTLYDYKGREVEKIPYNSDYILVRFWYDNESNEKYFYDGLEYQRHDENEFTQPITWNCSTPEQFYNNFLNIPEHNDLPIEFISNNQIKKLKGKKFYNKNNKAYFVDNQGYYYMGCKSDIKYKKEYEEFKDEKNAVWVTYGVPCSGKEFHKWFHSIDDFQIEYQKYVDNLPRGYGKPTYKILKHGYKKVTPNDCKYLARLPYFNLYKEYKLEKVNTYNTKSISNTLARKWCGLLKGYKMYGEPFQNEDYITDLINKWIEYSKL